MLVPTNLDLLADEYELARSYSESLLQDLSDEDVAWRPHEESSAIGWHLGHQAAVNQFMVRNLTAAEPSFDAALDRLFDSATPETDRGVLPSLDKIIAYRAAIGASTIAVVNRIRAGAVGAPDQLSLIASGLLHAVVNHEYQHGTWIAEVRKTLGAPAIADPSSDQVVQIDGYWVLE